MRLYHMDTSLAQASGTRKKNMMNDVTNCKVAVLAGGWSDEREVSLNSGHEVQAALRQAGFDTVDLLDIADHDFVATMATNGYDVAFLALHGEYGEDGCVQGLLEVLHVPYTFSGVLASSMAMEKDITKLVYERAGIPVAQGVTIEAGHTPTAAELDDIVRRLGLPMFVKPARNGSSFGITRVTKADELADAIRVAGEKGGRVLVEEAVCGTEITVPVLGNQDAEALPIIEIITGADFYDVKVKYEPSELHHCIPARLDAKTYALAQQYAVAAHRSLGCSGCSRSDFIVTDTGTPVILETNTIPGMTSASLLPDSARHGGIEFPDLCRRFVELALENKR